jgi:hypothetical protein
MTGDPKIDFHQSVFREKGYGMLSFCEKGEACLKVQLASLGKASNKLA